MATHCEAPHFPWIRIQEVAGEKWLVHDGTRERKQVGRNVHLMQADSGKAYIVDEGDATVFWINDILRYSLHECQGSERLMIWDKDKKESAWRDTAWGHSDARCLRLRPDQAREFWVELYVYKVPPFNPQGACVFWTLPYIIHWVYEGRVHNQFICRNIEAWKRQIHELGEDPDTHVIVSTKSLRAKYEARGELIPHNEYAKSSQEFAVSTIGILAILMHWDKNNADGTAKANEMLQALADLFIGGKCFVTGMDRCQLVFEDSKVSVRAFPGKHLPKPFQAFSKPMPYSIFLQSLKKTK